VDLRPRVPLEASRLEGEADLPLAPPRLRHRPVPGDDHPERACDGAVGAPPKQRLAEILGATWSDKSTYEDWLSCIAEGKRPCGRKTFSVRGIYSDLPRRWEVHARIVDGIVKSCTISGTAGW
jgi:hypothetical protein